MACPMTCGVTSQLCGFVLYAYVVSAEILNRCFERFDFAVDFGVALIMCFKLDHAFLELFRHRAVNVREVFSEERFLIGQAPCAIESVAFVAAECIVKIIPADKVSIELCGDCPVTVFDSGRSFLHGHEGTFIEHLQKGPGAFLPHRNQPVEFFQLCQSCGRAQFAEAVVETEFDMPDRCRVNDGFLVNFHFSGFSGELIIAKAAETPHFQGQVRVVGNRDSSLATGHVLGILKTETADCPQRAGDFTVNPPEKTLCAVLDNGK